MAAHALRIIMLSMLCCLTVCKNDTARHPDATAFATWFTGTTTAPPESFKRLSADSIDRFCKELRSRSVQGEGTITLTDTNSVPFTIGYAAPPSYHTDSLYPCVIYLHGGTGSESNSKGELAYRMLSMLGDSIMLFLASPSANRISPWWSPAGISRILQTVRFMSLYYPVDPDRIILAGVSDGATGCYAVANAVALPFAGFIAVSGFGGMLGNLGIELFPANLMQRPIYNVNAGNDRLYPVAMVNSFLDKLEQSGVGVERKIYPNEQHGFDYREKEHGAITALVKQWRKPEMSGVVWTGSTGHPSLMNQVLAAQPEEKTTTYSIQAVFKHDTLHVKTSGLRKVQMYFVTDTASFKKVLCRKDDQPCKALSIDRHTWKNDFIIMKQRCIPELRKMWVVTLK